MLYNYFMLSCTELTPSLRQVSPGCVHQLIICITQRAFAHSLNIQQPNRGRMVQETCPLFKLK